MPATGETTIFIYDASGKMAGEYSTIVETTDAKISYLTNDHLGSPRITTGRDGQTISRRDFQPFGEEIATSQRTPGSGYADDTVRRKFTSYERDNESDLDYAEARYYGYNHGRFTSPDPLMASANINSPQTFNRYTYVMNNPLNLTDPTGMKAGCPEGQKCETDDQGNEYYLDAAGKVVYTGVVGTVVTVGAKEAVKEVIIEPSWWEMAWYKIKKGGSTVGRITGKGLLTVARGAGAVVTILTNPTSTGCGASPGMVSDGNGGCVYDPTVDVTKPKIDTSNNPNTDDIKPNTDAETSPTLSKGGKQNKLDTGLADVSDEDVTKRSKDKSLPKAERERYKTEDKARKNRNKKKRGNK